MGDVLEGGIPAVSKGHVGCRQLGKGSNHRGNGGRCLEITTPLSLGNAPRTVPVLEIAPLAVGNQQVLVSIEIHIQNHRTPRPFTGLDTRLPGDVRPSAVPPIELQDIPLDLGPIGGSAGQSQHGGHARRLGVPPGPIAAEHIDGEEIDMPVAVQVPEIDSHGEGRIAPQCPGRQFPEAQGVIRTRLVHPNPIRGVQVIADIQVGLSIPVHVLEANGQPPIPAWRCQSFARGVQKAPPNPGDRNKTASPVVEEKYVFLPHFDHLSTGANLKAIGEIQCGHRAPIDRHYHRAGFSLPELVSGVGLIEHGGRAEVRHVKIQIPIAVHVGQGHRGGTTARAQPGRIGGFLKTALAVIEPQAGAAAQLIDQQVRIPVSIHIGKGRTGRIIRSRRRVEPTHPRQGLSRHVGETPVPEIAVHRIQGIQTAEEDIETAIAIHIGQRHSRAGDQIAVGHRPFFGQAIGEVDTQSQGRQSSEPR